MTSRCNKEMHAAGKSNLEDDQVIYDHRIVLFLSSFLDLPLSTFSCFFFSLISFLSSLPHTGIAEGRATPPNVERDAVGGMSTE